MPFFITMSVTDIQKLRGISPHRSASSKLVKNVDKERLYITNFWNYTKYSNH